MQQKDQKDQTSQTLHPYHILATVMSYPARGYKKTLSHDLNELMRSYPDETQEMTPFTQFCSQNSEDTIQELYTRTFDVTAICHLDIGYVLFGEDYKRGMFLVHMKGEHRRAQNDCGTELPDHLPNILNLLSKNEDQQFSHEFVETFFVPALEKMLMGFKDKGNVYSGPLNTILKVLKKDFRVDSSLQTEQGAVS